MDNKQIKELMSAMERWKIKKLSVKNKEGDGLELERDSLDSGHPMHLPSKKEPHPSRAPYHGLPHQKVEPGHAETKQGEEEGEYITSPMVGTFYTAQSPEEPAFVKAGDRVDSETVVCIIEAMKVMNEVKAGVSGVIREVYVENTQPVEFGAKLFKIE